MSAPRPFADTSTNPLENKNDTGETFFNKSIMGSTVVLATTTRPPPSDQKENPGMHALRPPFVAPYPFAPTAAAPAMMMHQGRAAPASSTIASCLPAETGSVGYHSMPPPPFPMLRYMSSAGYSDVSMPFPYLAYAQSFGVNGFFGPPPPPPTTLFQHSNSLDLRHIPRSSVTESFTTPTMYQNHHHHHHHPHKRTMSTGSTSVSSSDLDIAASALLDLTPSVHATTSNNNNNNNRQRPQQQQQLQPDQRSFAAMPFALVQKNIIKPAADAALAASKMKRVVAPSAADCTKRHKIGVDWEPGSDIASLNKVRNVSITTADEEVEETPDDLAFMLQNNASLAKNALQLIEESEETDIACKCKNTKCLKLYCSCFQAGKLCSSELCRCNGCENTTLHSVAGGSRTKAIFDTLKRRPDAFEKRLRKKTGEGCFCKKTRCLRKYCDCFSNKKYCGPMCGCTDCFNILPKDRLPLRSLATAYGVGSPAPLAKQSVAAAVPPLPTAVATIDE